jgi:cytochrome c551/c552
MRSQHIATLLFTAFGAANGSSLRGRKFHVEAAEARALAEQKACKICYTFTVV